MMNDKELALWEQMVELGICQMKNSDLRPLSVVPTSTHSNRCYISAQATAQSSR